MLRPPLFPPKPIRGWANTELHTKLIKDKNWIVEPKANGDRCLVFILESGVELWNRHGGHIRYTWLGGLRAELASWDLPIGCVLDCELLHEPQPKQDLMVFDVPSAGGNLAHRKEVLKELFRGTRFKFVKMAPRMIKKTAYEEALKLGHEGVVWKRFDSPYEWQRSNQGGNEVAYWIKMKPAETFR